MANSLAYMKAPYFKYKIIYTFHLRSVEIENIDKIINCGLSSFGGAKYKCPDCGHIKLVPFRCHSRFCPSYGVKYSMERTTSMSFKLIHFQHRHCILAIDECLKDFFFNARSLLNCLFHAVKMAQKIIGKIRLKGIITKTTSKGRRRSAGRSTAAACGE